jgi:hypothetical protein
MKAEFFDPNDKQASKQLEFLQSTDWGSSAVFKKSRHVTSAWGFVSAAPPTHMNVAE